jgi:hypothetical protein
MLSRYIERKREDLIEVFRRQERLMKIDINIQLERIIGMILAIGKISLQGTFHIYLNILQ